MEEEENTYQESNQELIGLGAHELIKLRNDSDIRVPGDLNTIVHDAVMSKLDEGEFKVPQDFFEKNQAEFMNQVEPEIEAKPRTFKLNPWTLPLLAADVLAVVFLIPGSTSEENCHSFDCLLAETELGVADYELLYESGGELSELVSDDTLFMDITEDEAMDYLLESDFETEELW